MTTVLREKKVQKRPTLTLTVECGLCIRGFRVLHLRSLSEDRFSAGFAYNQNLTMVGNGSCSLEELRHGRKRGKVAGPESIGADNGRDELIVSDDVVNDLTQRRGNEWENTHHRSIRSIILMKTPTIAPTEPHRRASAIIKLAFS